jgi:HPt (histidine-containing phosphotransfer) domain-containing protein
MLLERLVLLLWHSDRAGETGLLELQERCAQLEEQLAQERDHGAMLNRYIKQMEKELDHYLADHERAATLAERLPLLLQRARQQLGTCSTLHP